MAHIGLSTGNAGCLQGTDVSFRWTSFGESEPVCSLEDGIMALRLALAARESQAKGLPIQLTGAL